MDKPQAYYAKWKKQDRNITYYMIPFIQTVQERQIYRDRAGYWLPGAGIDCRRGIRDLFVVMFAQFFSVS